MGGGYSVQLPFQRNRSSDPKAFEVGEVPDGAYEVEAGWVSYDAEHRRSIGHRGHVLVSVGGSDVIGLVIRADTNAEVEGKLDRSKSGQITTETVLRFVDVTGVGETVEVPIRVDGTFNSPALPSGEYRITVGGTSDAYAVITSVDGALLTDSGFRIPNGLGKAVIQVELVDGASLNGRLSGLRNDVPHYIVLAKSRKTGEDFVSIPDQFGNFSVRGLSPGYYDLYAWPASDYLDFANPEMLQKYENDKMEVSIPGTYSITSVILPVSWRFW
jgi:hypothetical protein